MNGIVLILFVFEVISLLCASYMFIFGDWEKVIQRPFCKDYEDYVLISYIIAFFLGWCTVPIFVVAVLKSK